MVPGVAWVPVPERSFDQPARFDVVGIVRVQIEIPLGPAFQRIIGKSVEQLDAGARRERKHDAKRAGHTQKRRQVSAV